MITHISTVFFLLKNHHYKHEIKKQSPTKHLFQFNNNFQTFLSANFTTEKIKPKKILLRKCV